MTHICFRAQVTKEVFKAAGGRLKVVGRAGVGVDNVDLASATDMAPLLCKLSPSACKQRVPLCMICCRLIVCSLAFLPAEFCEISVRRANLLRYTELSREDHQAAYDQDPSIHWRMSMHQSMQQF